jgi:hypothetical protein
MPHYFKYHPIVDYDALKNDVTVKTQNPLVRHKFVNLLGLRSGTYYTYIVQEHETAQFIADKYYDDVTLDWIIYMANNIIDPQYDWPLTYLNLIEFIKAKYGTVAAAQSQVHHYEQILYKGERLSNGTIVKEKTFQVDLATYNSIGDSSFKREVSNYNYEILTNDAKREIKIVRKEFLPGILRQQKVIFR